jgi:hypothetical protein
MYNTDGANTFINAVRRCPLNFGFLLIYSIQSRCRMEPTSRERLAEEFLAALSIRMQEAFQAKGSDDTSLIRAIRLELSAHYGSLLLGRAREENRLAHLTSQSRRGGTRCSAGLVLRILQRQFCRVCGCSLCRNAEGATGCPLCVVRHPQGAQPPAEHQETLWPVRKKVCRRKRKSRHRISQAEINVKKVVPSLIKSRAGAHRGGGKEKAKAVEPCAVAKAPPSKIHAKVKVPPPKQGTKFAGALAALGL